MSTHVRCSIYYFICINHARQIHCLLNFVSEEYALCCSTLVKMLSEGQTAWIWVGSQVTQHLSRSKMFAYGTIVVVCRLRVKPCSTQTYPTGTFYMFLYVLSHHTALHISIYEVGHRCQGLEFKAYLYITHFTHFLPHVLES